VGAAVAAQRAGQPADKVSSFFAQAASHIVGLREGDRHIAAEVSRVDAFTLAARREVDVRGQALQDLAGEREQLAYEIRKCEATALSPALDEDLLAPTEGQAALGAKQARLRHRAMELQRRRELHARIGKLHDEVAAARTKRQRLMGANEQVRPDLEKLLASASALKAFLTLPAAPPPDRIPERADSLPRPLFLVFAKASAALHGGNLTALYGVAVVDAPPPQQGLDAFAPLARPSQLAVRLDVLCARSRMALVFTYLPHLHVLAVHAPEGGADTLSELGATDDGSTFPHCRALLASSRSVPKCTVRDLLPGMPFRWAQWLGGIEPDELPADGSRRASSGMAFGPGTSIAEVLCVLAERR